MRRPVLTLVLLASTTFFLGLGRQAVTDRDEAYYAEAAREMVESGDWLTPHFNYEDRWQKPVLYYWLTAAIYEVTGPTETAARFWSALSGVGLVLLTFGIARDSDLSPHAAWLSAAITATCFGYFAEARQALPDLPLTFCITLTVWMVLRQRWPVAGIAAGLGFLLKGPVALAVPALAVLPVWWRERASLRLQWSGVVVALVLFLAIGIPWYVAMTLTHGRAYLESFFLGDNLERFATSRFAGRTSSSWWFYGPILLGGFIPWTPLAASLLIGRLSSRFRGSVPVQTCAAEWRLILWAVMPLLFFTLSLGKQPRYILPVLPPLAVLLGAAIWRRVDSHERRQPALLVGSLLTAVLFAATVVLLFRARPLFLSAHESLTTLTLVALGAWAAAMAVLALQRRWRRLMMMLPLAAATLLLSLQFGALAGLRPEAVERMARLLRTHRTAGEPIGDCSVFVRNLVFYTRSRMQNDLCAVGLEPALAFLKSQERVLLVVRDEDADALRDAGATVRELGRVHYVEPANIKLGTLLAPMPEENIEAILLVTNR